MNVTMHVIDPDFRRRAQLAQAFRTLGLHAEIYEDVSEYSRVDHPLGYVFAAEWLATEGSHGVIDDLKSADGILPVVVYSEKPVLEKVVAAIKNGASDYLAWPFSVSSLDLALKRLAADGNPDLLRRRAEAQRRLKSLSRREREVLHQLVAGARNQDVAGLLGISVRTVEIHRRNLMHKLAATTLADAVRMAFDAGLFPNGVMPENFADTDRDELADTPKS
jgi:two-component system response regulator FixJ